MKIYRSELECVHPAPDIPFHEFMFRRLEELQKMAEDSNNEDITVAFINGSNESEVITYEMVIEFSKSLAAWFRQQNYEKGDRVLLCMSNCWQYAICCLGAWSAGLVISPTSPQFSAGEIYDQLQDSESVAIICDAASLEKIDTAVVRLRENAIRQIICVSSLPLPEGIISFNETLFTSPVITPMNVSLQDLLMLPYSSGTTGKPKGVMITHSNYSYMVLNYLRKATSDGEKTAWGKMFVSPKVVTYLPVYHALGIFHLMTNLYNGSCQIMMAKYNENELLKKINKHEVWVLASIPSILNSLVQNPLFEEMARSLMVIGSGSAPLHKSVIEKIQNKLPGIRIAQGYGMTEMSTASHISDSEAEPSSIGKLIPGTYMKIINENGQHCEPHEEGEIYIKGPQIMAGYWKRREATESTFDHEGFLRTGDIGYIYENNYTYITDRAKELIKVNGKQVAPSELESVVGTLDFVREVCVIGIQDELRGEVPMAVVVPRTDIQKLTRKQMRNEILRTVKDSDRLAPYKQLRGGVVFVPELPKTPNGKVKRRVLKLQFHRPSTPAVQPLSKL